MTTTASTESPSIRRNVALLATCQALFTSTMSIMIAVGGLIGYSLAENKALATLPVTAVVTGTALMTMPAAMLMGRIGRRGGFVFGALIGTAGALLGAVALYYASFWLFCLATLTVGMFSAFGQQYRHAAVDMAPAPLRGQAVSLVMLGGVAAGFIGPELAKWTRDMLEPLLYAGTYIAASGLTLLSALILSRLDIPRRPRVSRADQGRPAWQIMRQPTFIVAAGSGMAGFGAMSLIMTATPLAMVACGHDFNSSATVIQWHVVAMYAPSFITGRLIGRVGVLPVIVAGAVINVLCVAVAHTGLEVLHFWTALVLLGIGWNFMFVGGTTLLAEAHTPAEAPRAQGINDFLVFGVVAVSSLSSGQLLHAFGWDVVTFAALPMISLALMGAVWLSFRKRMPLGA